MTTLSFQKLPSSLSLYPKALINSYKAKKGSDLPDLKASLSAVGIDRVAQVDLGVRHHRNRTLEELGPQALAVGQAILDPHLELLGGHGGRAALDDVERLLVEAIHQPIVAQVDEAEDVALGHQRRAHHRHQLEVHHRL